MRDTQIIKANYQGSKFVYFALTHPLNGKIWGLQGHLWYATASFYWLLSITANERFVREVLTWITLSVLNQKSS